MLILKSDFPKVARLMLCGVAGSDCAFGPRVRRRSAPMNLDSFGAAVPSRTTSEGQAGKSAEISAREGV